MSLPRFGVTRAHRGLLRISRTEEKRRQPLRKKSSALHARRFPPPRVLKSSDFHPRHILDDKVSTVAHPSHSPCTRPGNMVVVEQISGEVCSTSAQDSELESGAFSFWGRNQPKLGHRAGPRGLATFFRRKSWPSCAMRSGRWLCWSDRAVGVLILSGGDFCVF